VGDSFTRSGVARGGGRDKIHGLTGADVLYGDDHAAAKAGRSKGGGRDLLTGGGGNDRLHGGPKHDNCAGGPGRDTANNCEFKSGIP
jgi:Ca2+-binding RTX toxin-like protein